VHLRGSCALDCVTCDCRHQKAEWPIVERTIREGGRRLTLRSAEGSPWLERAVGLARECGFSEVVARVSGVAHADPERARELERAGVDAVLLPFFSHDPRIHDRLARAPNAMVMGLMGLRALAAVGLAVDVEIPLFSTALQDLTALVDLLKRAAPDLRSARFYTSTQDLPAKLAHEPWGVLAPLLARAITRCIETDIAVTLSNAEGVPVCALADDPTLQGKVIRFNPKGKRPRANLPTACGSCAIKRQCGSVPLAYQRRYGDQGLRPYSHRPRHLFDVQRTTPLRRWTDVERDAARKVGLLVLRPTVDCNQDCVFCSANETSNNVNEDPDKMVRQIARRARNPNLHQISFGGGEPTLSKHLVTFIDTARRAGVSAIDLVTNGVLLARESKVIELKAAGLTRAMVSLHAHDEELARSTTLKAGDFQKTVAGLHNLIKHDIRVTVNHVVSALNYRHLERFVEFFHAEFHGKPSLSFAFITPQFRALEHLELVPRLSDVMPYLARAMYRALELKQPFVVGSRQGIPPCFLKEFAGWSDFFMYGAESTVEDAFQKKPYARRYGTDELEPIEGRRAEPEDFLCNAAGDRTWAVQPLAFEEVPTLLRNPERERMGLLGWPVRDTQPAPIHVARSRHVRALLAGSAARAHHLFQAALPLSGFAIDAVASPHAPGSGDPRFGSRPTYNSVAEAIDEAAPECLVIASATLAHEPLLRLAIERGLPVLVEKPVTGDSAVVRELEAEAAARGVLVMPAHQVLFADGLERLLDRGPSAEVSLTRRVPAHQPDLPKGWSKKALFETLYHLAALIGAVASGKLEKVTVLQLLGDSQPERLRLSLEYEGTRAELLVEGKAGHDELSLSAGDLTWARRDNELTLREGQRSERIERTHGDATRMLSHFGECVLGRASPRVGLADAARAIDAVNQILSALEAAGANFARPQGPRHAATKALVPRYSK
jgi:MoaA/NifB/PqqE/SkfB family radical SAM enzyme/predicted dehydrogenase